MITHSLINIKERKQIEKKKMGKNLSMMLMMAMILAVVVIGNEVKLNLGCGNACDDHCKPTSTVGECADCRKSKRCMHSQPSATEPNLKDHHNNKRYDLLH